MRIDEGPTQGAFLFSPSTVARAEEFYEKVRELPLRRDVPIPQYAEMRPYLSSLGWLISSRSIEFSSQFDVGMHPQG